MTAKAPTIATGTNIAACCPEVSGGDATGSEVTGGGVTGDVEGGVTGDVEGGDVGGFDEDGGIEGGVAIHAGAVNMLKSSVSLTL